VSNKIRVGEENFKFKFAEGVLKISESSREKRRGG